MKLNSLRTMVVLAAVSAASAVAATPTLGVASAVGSFTVNSAPASGNANIFDGSQLKTDKAPSQVLLHNGSTLSLSTNSAGTFYSDRFQLEQGGAKVDNLGRYSISASGYRVEGDQPNAGTLVRFDGKTVEVAALSGSLRVFNSEGALLTHVGAGTAASFQSGAGTGDQTADNSTPPKKNKKGTGAAGAGVGAGSALLYGAIGAAVVGGLAAGTVIANDNSGGGSSSTSP